MSIKGVYHKEVPQQGPLFFVQVLGYLEFTENSIIMWWAKFFLLITITAAVTWLIVWMDSRFKKALKEDPEALKKRGYFRMIVYAVLNLRDVF
jgi:hypothetical protein